MNNLDLSQSLILIIDDISDNIQVMAKFLKSKNYEISFALSGEEGLETLKYIKPDLILLDLLMPKMDGLEVCSRIKKNPETSDIPIIFITGSPEENNLVKAFEMGAADYITKPFKPLELLARVDHQLRIRKQSIELEKLIERLNRSNQALEDFAHSISHDLQQPLQVMIGFSNLLEENYKGQLNSQTKQYFLNLNNAGKRLNNMIQDLLNYARLSYEVSLETEVDAQEVMTEVFNSLKLIIVEKQAKIHCDDLPILKINKNHLYSLFQNLISNALKFSRNNHPPEITITVQKNSPNTWLFAIKDNGIGIKTEDLEKVFIIFRRVHLDKKIPGSGIGLTNCKKIVELSGGKIWIESTLGEGSTVYFTLAS